MLHSQVPKSDLFCSMKFTNIFPHKYYWDQVLNVTSIQKPPICPFPGKTLQSYLSDLEHNKWVLPVFELYRLCAWLLWLNSISTRFIPVIVSLTVTSLNYIFYVSIPCYIYPSWFVSRLRLLQVSVYDYLYFTQSYL